MRSVLTIAFQFPFENNLADSVVTMARQYVRSVINSIQRVAMAISPSGLSLLVASKLSPSSPEALTLAHWICHSYTYYLGLDMLETTLVALQDITLDKMFDEAGRKALFPEFAKKMQEGYAYLSGGICMSTMGRRISYE
ncbi:putative class III homeodomain-leucine zipper family [Helianthus annuus]|nr:putative class III homeodomain-leucine zipper family [Helianthus annuus]